MNHYSEFTTRACGLPELRYDDLDQAIKTTTERGHGAIDLRGLTKRTQPRAAQAHHASVVGPKTSRMSPQRSQTAAGRLQTTQLSTRTPTLRTSAMPTHRGRLSPSHLADPRGSRGPPGIFHVTNPNTQYSASHIPAQTPRPSRSAELIRSGHPITTPPPPQPHQPRPSRAHPNHPPPLSPAHRPPFTLK